MKLDVIQNGAIIASHSLAEGSHKIGRGGDCEIKLNSPQISKQHALIVIKGEKAAIVDLGSANGVFVNGILVRKQRINAGDDVTIADFKLRLSRELKMSSSNSNHRPKAAGAAFDGNLAQDYNSFEIGAAPAPATSAKNQPDSAPQEKLLNFVDSKVLIPYYTILRTTDWRFVLAIILIVTMVASVIAGVYPIIRWGEQATTDISLKRAHSVLNQAVRENYRILQETKGEYSRLTVEVVEKEAGFIEVFIIDPVTKAILAPAKLTNATFGDDRRSALAALAKFTQDKGNSLDKFEIKIGGDNNIWVVAQPIYQYAADTNNKTLSAVVLAYFEAGADITQVYEPVLTAVLIALFLCLLAFFFIFKMFSYPINKMNEQIDAALKGEQVAITSEAQFPELENLAQQVNFAISRLKQNMGEQSITSEDTEAEDAMYLATIRGVAEGTSDALLLLDMEKKVVFVSDILGDLVGLRNQYAQGQNISDACKDSGMAGTAIDLADGVVQSLGATQQATLDINGVSREMVAIGHKSATGELRHVLIVIQLGTEQE